MNKELISTIISSKYNEAHRLLESQLAAIKERKLVEMKKMIAAKDYIKEDTEDESFLSEARIRIIKIRIRKGKIQRRKKVSTIKGYTFRQGKLQRMSPTERRHRRIGQRRGKIKRRAKRARIQMKRARSLRKRHALGL